MTSTETAEEILGVAYFILQLLPPNPDQSAPLLKMIEMAIDNPGSQSEGWTGPASYAFSHLRKRDRKTAAMALAVAHEIVEGVRPRFAAIAYGGFA